MPRCYQSLSLQNSDDSCKWLMQMMDPHYRRSMTAQISLPSHQSEALNSSTAKQPNSQSRHLHFSYLVLRIITISGLPTIWPPHSSVSTAYLSVPLRDSFLKPLFFHTSWSLRCTCSSSNFLLSGLSLINRNSHSYLQNPNSYPLHYEWLRYILFCYESGARYLWLGHF